MCVWVGCYSRFPRCVIVFLPNKPNTQQQLVFSLINKVIPAGLSVAQSIITFLFFMNTATNPAEENKNIKQFMNSSAGLVFCGLLLRLVGYRFQRLPLQQHKRQTNQPIIFFFLIQLMNQPTNSMRLLVFSLINQ